jgi:hypothetical protein
MEDGKRQVKTVNPFYILPLTFYIITYSSKILI